MQSGLHVDDQIILQVVCFLSVNGKIMCREQVPLLFPPVTLAVQLCLSPHVMPAAVTCLVDNFCKEHDYQQHTDNLAVFFFFCEGI